MMKAEAEQFPIAACPTCGNAWPEGLVTDAEGNPTPCEVCMEVGSDVWFAAHQDDDPRDRDNDLSHVQRAFVVLREAHRGEVDDSDAVDIAEACLRKALRGER